MGIKLYVGAHGSRFQARVCDLTGSRCFSAAYSPPGHYSSEQAEKIECLLDSGAFTDPPAKRLSASQALERQLAWERKASKLWKTPTPNQSKSLQKKGEEEMRKAKIDSNQRVIVHGLREAGCSVESLASLGRGVPDLLVGFRGVTYLLEVKSSGGKLNSCQKGWHEKWRGQVAVVQSLDEAKRVVGL